MRRALVLAAVLALVVTPACGSGDDESPTGTIAAGPLVMALPFLPAGATESLRVGLRNLSTTPATVYVTAHLPGGAPYAPGTVPVMLPAQGGVRIPLVTFIGAAIGAGGWIEVETRDPTVLDAEGEPSPVVTSGFVAAYVHRVEAGRESDATLAEAFRSDLTYVNLTERALSYQIVNRSYDPLAGGSTHVGVDVVVTVYDAFGGSTSAPLFIPADGSASSLATAATGRVEVVPATGAAQSAPATTKFLLAVSSFEADPQVMIEARLLDVPRPLGQRDVGFGLEFGWDPAGNAHDFAVVLTNPTAEDAAVLLEGIYRANGSAILATPRVIGIDAGHTKYLATTTDDSRGLDVGEESPFFDVFGDIGLTTGFDVFFLDWSVPIQVEASARAFPAQFKTWYRILPGRKLTTDAIVLGVEVPSSTGLGVRNFLHLMNPQDREFQVQVRGFTPGGTEYVLDPVNLGAFSRIDWSPDGQIFREDPTDTTGPAVPFMAFRFTSAGGIYVDARRVRYSTLDEITNVRPHPVRDLRAD